MLLNRLIVSCVSRVLRLVAPSLMVLVLCWASAAVAADDTKQRAMQAVWAEKYKEAAALFDEVLKENPADAEAKVWRARIAYWAGDSETAARLYGEYLAANPIDLDAKAEYCRTLFWLGKNPEAESCSREVLAVEAENVQANLTLASALQAQGKAAEKEKIVAWITVIDPNNKDVKGIEEIKPAPVEPPVVKAAAPQAGQVEQEPVEPEPPAEELDYTIHSENLLEADKFNYFGFRSLLGFNARVASGLFVDPRLLYVYASDARVTKDVSGLGGGLLLSYSPIKELTFTATGSYIPLKGQRGTVEAWGVDGQVVWALAEGASVFVGGYDRLHGLDKQSAEALIGQIRRRGGEAGVYFERGSIRLVASGSSGTIKDGPVDYGRNSSWWFSPALKLPVQGALVYVGYGMWGTSYDKPAPALAWWSPDWYLSHTAYIELSKPITRKWSADMSIGIGLGQEKVRPTASTSSYWDIAGVGNGRLGLTFKPGQHFDTSLAGNLGLSSREDKTSPTKGVTTYWYWQVMLNVAGHF